MFLLDFLKLKIKKFIHDMVLKEFLKAENILKIENRFLNI